ncbi:MAG: heme lyase CcmF/NrfE family subunit, partial [Candidatus Limnocylindria bacterium]
MTPTIGHAVILVGLALTTYAIVAFVLAARTGDPRLTVSARRAVIGSFAAAVIGCAAMVFSLLSHDFSVLYVAENNATTTPSFISAISLWAALEGSILFWALL